MLDKEAIALTQKLIGQGQLGIAIEKLQQDLKETPLQTSIIIFSARYNELKKKMIDGTISQEQQEVSQNKITSGLLNLLENMEKDNIPEQEAIPEGNITINKNFVKGNINNSGTINIGDQS